MFPVYGGKCLWLKAVHNCVEKFCQGRSKVTDDVRPSVEFAETRVKRLLWCGFRRTGKAMGQIYHCWWRICGEINGLRFICICNLFTDPSSYGLSISSLMSMRRCVV
jgi:hypothetical protein